MRRPETAQILGALILCASVAAFSIRVGCALLGVLTIAYGVLAEMARDSTEPEPEEQK